MIQLALRKMRGDPAGSSPDISSAPQIPAPTANAPGLDQAYAQPMAGNSSAQSPFQLNQTLEAQAAGQNSQLNPIISQIMQHLGLLNFIRNRSNQQMVDPVSQG